MQNISLPYNQLEAESLLSVGKVLQVLHGVNVNSVLAFGMCERQNAEKLLRPRDLPFRIKYREEHILHLALRGGKNHYGWQVVHMTQMVVDKDGVLCEMGRMLQPARNNNPASLPGKHGVLGIILWKRKRRVSEGPTILELRQARLQRLVTFLRRKHLHIRIGNSNTHMATIEP